VAGVCVCAAPAYLGRAQPGGRASTCFTWSLRLAGELTPKVRPTTQHKLGSLPTQVSCASLPCSWPSTTHSLFCVCLCMPVCACVYVRTCVRLCVCFVGGLGARGGLVPGDLPERGAAAGNCVSPFHASAFEGRRMGEKPAGEGRCLCEDNATAIAVGNTSLSKSLEQPTGLHVCIACAGMNAESGN